MSEPARKMEVMCCIDDSGKLRVTMEPGMNIIEAIAMLQVAIQTLEKKAVNDAKIVLRQPVSPFLIKTGA